MFLCKRRDTGKLGAAVGDVTAITDRTLGLPIALVDIERVLGHEGVIHRGIRGVEMWGVTGCVKGWERGLVLTSQQVDACKPQGSGRTDADLGAVSQQGCQMESGR